MPSDDKPPRLGFSPRSRTASGSLRNLPNGEPLPSGSAHPWPTAATPVPAARTELRRRWHRTYDLGLWPTVHPVTGREGLPPVALVVEAGRKRTRPGAKPPTPQEKEEQAKPDHRRLLRRLQNVEAASEASWHAPVYPAYPAYGDAGTARDHHRELPAVATTPPLLRRRGAGAPIWHRLGRPGWNTSPLRSTTRTVTSCSPSSGPPPSRSGRRRRRRSGSGTARPAPAALRRSRTSDGPSASRPPPRP
ncbi:hypothetical protein [Kitasatospora sp. McL0602]|uniref:hypothetical protein n=1 Tax=Kitasatospora sp. McL0602 TaxID=3439530 RepID=UPI003F8C2A81